MLHGLLDFTVSYLGMNSDRPFDASRYAIDTFLIALFDPKDESQVDHLLCHVYLRALQCVPGLAQRWYIDHPHRATKQAIGKYCEKYLSALIIQKDFESVNGVDPSVFGDLVVKVRSTFVFFRLGMTSLIRGGK